MVKYLLTLGIPLVKMVNWAGPGENLSPAERQSGVRPAALRIDRPKRYLFVVEPP